MTPQQFTSTYRWVADLVSAGTGIDPIALLAQWWNETAAGTRWAGAPFNLGNIEQNGIVITWYGNYSNFASDCIATFHNGLYNPVLAATNAVDQLDAICASPWASGHYGGSLLPEYQLLEAYEMTPEEHQWLADIHQSIGSNTFRPGQTMQAGIAEIESGIVDLKAGGGTEPPEPAEPTKVTLNIPAQTISGTLS